MESLLILVVLYLYHEIPPEFSCFYVYSSNKAVALARALYYAYSFVLTCSVRMPEARSKGYIDVPDCLCQFLLIILFFFKMSKGYKYVSLVAHSLRLQIMVNCSLLLIASLFSVPNIYADERVENHKVLLFVQLKPVVHVFQV